MSQLKPGQPSPPIWLDVYLRFTVARPVALTAAETTALKSLLAEFNELAEAMFPKNKDWDFLSPYDGHRSPLEVFVGQTLLPSDPVTGPFQPAIALWCHLLGRIRTDILPDANWSADIHGTPLVWDATTSTFSVNLPS